MSERESKKSMRSTDGQGGEYKIDRTRRKGNGSRGTRRKGCGETKNRETDILNNTKFCKGKRAAGRDQCKLGHKFYKGIKRF